MNHWLLAIRNVNLMLWHNLPRRPRPLLSAGAMLALFLLGTLLMQTPEQAFVIAFTGSMIVQWILRLQAIRQSGQSISASALRKTTIFWLVVFLVMASIGSAVLCLRFWQGFMLFTVLVGIAQEWADDYALASQIYPSIRKPEHLAWFTRMQVHIACAWIIFIEYMLWFAAGDWVVMVMLAAFLPFASGLSWNILASLTLQRDQWQN